MEIYISLDTICKCIVDFKNTSVRSIQTCQILFIFVPIWAIPNFWPLMYISRCKKLTEISYGIECRLSPREDRVHTLESRV